MIQRDDGLDRHSPIIIQHLFHLEPKQPKVPLRGHIERMCLSSISAAIAAGTSEIQRNIVATMGLGLPR